MSPATAARVKFNVDAELPRRRLSCQCSIGRQKGVCGEFSSRRPKHFVTARSVTLMSSITQDRHRSVWSAAHSRLLR